MRINYKKFKDSYEDLKVALQNEMIGMNRLSEAFDAFIQMDSFQGDTADAAKAYVQDVHKQIIQTFQMVMTDLNLKIVLALDNFKEDVDDSETAIIDTDYLQEIIHELEAKEEEFPTIEEQFNSILGEIADIFTPQTDTKGIGNTIKEGYNETIKETTDVRNSLITFNEAHEGDCDDINEVLDDLQAILDFVPNVTLQNKRDYTINNLAIQQELESVRTYSNKVAGNLLQQLTNQKVSTEDVDLLTFDPNNKEVDPAKIREGIAKEVNGAILAGGGALAAFGVSAVLTDGLSIALVAAGGTASVGFGTSDFFEGSQDIKNGLEGNSDQDSLNPIRDTLFRGNQEAYMIAELAAGMITMAGAEEAASISAVEGIEESEIAVAGIEVEESELVVPGIEVSEEASLTETVGKGISSTAVEYKEGFDSHLVNGTLGKGSKGIVGGHNLNEFKNVLTDAGFDVDDCFINMKEHPTIKGIYEVEYRIPAKKYGMTGELEIVPSQYKTIKYPKTVYDPSIISDFEIIEWGKEAMESGTIQGRNIYGYSLNGIRFEGYIDETTGKITNFYPVVE